MRLFIVLVLMVACAGAATAEVHEVMVANFSFSPSDIEINVGDTVRWVWVGGSHTTTSGTGCTPDGLWDAPLTSGNPTFEFTFDEQGVFDYFCIPHCTLDMVGVVTVTGSSSVGGEDIGSRAGLRPSPNPAPGRTDLRFRLEAPGRVTLDLADVQGRRVREVFDGELGAGVHNFTWRGRSDGGENLPAGIYFARLISPDGPSVAKIYLFR
jgi:plastocyanin